MQARAVATVGLLLFLSFVLGYKGDVLEKQLARLRSSRAPEAAPQNGGAPAPPSAPGNAAPPDVPPGISGLGPPAPIPLNIPPGAPPPGIPQVAQDFHPDPPPVVPQGNLTTTLDSIRPPEPTDELRAQRNTYFDALQKQLAEMRQNQPPPNEMPPPPPVSNVAPPGPQQGFSQQTAPPFPPNSFPVVPGAQLKGDPEAPEEVEEVEPDEAPEETGSDDEDG